MLGFYFEWPKQIKSAVETWSKYYVKGDFDEVVVAGMGGSGIVGDYVQVLSATASSGLPVYVTKSHIVPSFVDKSTLFIAISYSGNTVETLLALRRALERGAVTVVVSSGGVLEEEARKRNLLYVPVTKGLLPRASLPQMLYSVLGLLDASGYTIVSRGEALESAEFLEENLDECNLLASELAKWLYEKVISEGKLVVVATHSPLEPLAVRSKNELNENGKVVAKVDVAPEWMHNDIVGYETPTPRGLGVLELVDPDDSVGSKLVDFMEKIYSKQDSTLYRLWLKGKSTLEKLMYGSLVVGIASVKLAELRGVNPAETPYIAQYKSTTPEIFGH